MKKNICLKDALFTDFYELTMAQGYFLEGMNDEVVFEMFFRRQPFNGGFSVFAGLETLLDALTEFSFSEDDIDFLRKEKIFDERFLEYLKGFHFSGDLYSFEEGSFIFPQEPIIRIHANLIEAQIIEGLVLNIINFQSLIATKTARVYLASKKGNIMEFGLRRAQGFDGSLSASRAAFIGGASSTSNTLAAKTYGIPTGGTMAHSWVMSFENELDAFETYAKLYPENSIFLIDTYDTLKSGIKNAITAGKNLLKKGYNFGVRLDSGDIDYLSRQVRKELDEAGAKEAKIFASNELNEEIIEALVKNQAPVDGWGVGTEMITGGSESSFSGVYKLTARRNKFSKKLIPVMKFSDNPSKNSNPGLKKIYRLFDEDGMARGDVLTLEGEEILGGKEYRYFHPMVDYRSFSYQAFSVKEMLKLKLKNGKRVNANGDPSFGLQESSPLYEKKILEESKKRMEEEIDFFDSSYKRILNPRIYKVSLSQGLRDLKVKFIEDLSLEKEKLEKE